ARQLQDLRRAMHSLAEGNLDTDVPRLGGRDEASQMAEALHVLKSRLVNSRELDEERMHAESRQSGDRRAAMHTLADQFEIAVGNIVATVTSSANDLQAAAGSLGKTAETTQQLSTTVAAASEEASVNVNSVASASERLSESVKEISRRVH